MRSGPTGIFSQLRGRSSNPQTEGYSLLLAQPTMTAEAETYDKALDELKKACTHYHL